MARYRVTQIMNITDVDDRIIQNANAAGQDIYSYTAPYITTFHESLCELSHPSGRAYPRATGYIPQMVDLVEQLTARGHTYAATARHTFASRRFRTTENSRASKSTRRADTAASTGSLRQGKRP